MNNATNSAMNLYFQADNIRDFLENYTHFHLHFSILHIPTFRIMEAYVGLIAGMCCIGACYSDGISAANIREVMNFLKAALEGSSRMYASLSEDVRDSVKYEYDSFGTNRQDLEELQAIMLTQVLFCWHGTPLQREKARRTFPLIAALARKAGLLRVSKDMSLTSPIHQPDFSPQSFNPSNFDWWGWVEQEKRIRLMYFIFLSDAALGLYFNTGPEFDPDEIHLPLPADDAAWDANTSSECAEALGLYGLQAARIRNPDGTQRWHQPEMHQMLKAVLYSPLPIQLGATNLFGKFILMHALLAMMRRVQLKGSAALGSISWTEGGASNANSNGRPTPADLNTNLLDAQTAKTLWSALDKFKVHWDTDMAAQFPPSGVIHPRRYGFCRDGIHFYWLARYLLKNTRAVDLRMPPDQRFTHVIHLLKSVKNWVMTDGASRGEELGSVGDIDKNYGVTDLTLDMTQLFRPSPRMSGSPSTTTA
jgi:hypothetical protein